MTKQPLWTGSFIALSLINFLTFFGFQLLLPVFPLHLDSLGIGKQEAGLVMAAFTVAVIPMRPIASRWLDRGLSHFCIIFGIIVSVAATGSYWFAASALFMMLSRMLHGCGFGVSTVTYGTLVASLIPQGRRAEGMGYFGLSLSLSMCLGPWAGPWLYQNYGFNAVLGVSIFCVLAALPVVMKIPLTAPQTSFDKTSRKRLFSIDNLFEKSAWFPSLLFSLVGVGWSTVIGFVALWARELDVIDIGSFFLVNAIFSFFVRLGTGKIADRFGFSYVILPAALSLIVGFLLLGAAHDKTSLLISAIFLGSGLGVLMPIFQAWVINNAPLERRTAAMAMYYNSYDVGIGFGLAFWGTFAHHFGFALMYLVASGIIGLMLVLYIGYLVKQRTISKQKALL